MGYRLEAGEAVSKAVRRIVREQVDHAGEYLARKKEGGPDEAVHEARKSLKKIRAVLRLVQTEIGPVYRKENAAMRGIAAELSEIRDAAAIIETFDELPGAAGFGSVRDALMARKQRTDAAKDRDSVIKEAAIALKRLARRVKTWPLKTTGFAAIAPGLEDRYRRGRKAMKLAAREQTPQRFHEWRKRVKDHWYHTRLIEPLWSDEMQAREKSLKDLETWLGDDHNLFVLRSLIAAEPAGFGEAPTVEAALDAIDKRQKELRENALSLGARLYDEKPKALTRRMAHLWKEWSQRPEELARAEAGERAGTDAGKQSVRKPAAKAGRRPRGNSQVA